MELQLNWSIVCTLLTPPLLNDIIDFFLYTRSYQEGLDFIERCYSIMEQAPDKEPNAEAIVHDTLKLFQLVLYDKMNLWDRYVNEYELFVPMLASTIKDAARYETIKQKLSLLLQGENVDCLKCHARYELSDEELLNRYEYVMRRIKKHLGGL